MSTSSIRRLTSRRLRASPLPLRLQFVCDIDGTLLGDDDYWPAEELDVLAQHLSNSGYEVEFYLATGRSPTDCAALLQGGPTCMNPVVAFCFDGAVTVRISNGAVVEVLSEVDLAQFFVRRAAGDLYGELGSRGDLLAFSTIEQGSQVFLFRGDNDGSLEASCPSGSERLRAAVEDDRPLRVADNFHEFVTAIETHKIRAVSWFGHQDHLPSDMNIFLAEQRQTLGCLLYPEVRLGPQFAAYRWVELVNSSVSKGQSMSDQLERAVGAVKSIYVGNGANDLSGIRYTDLSLCPSDSVPEVKRIATKTVNLPGGAPFVSGLWSHLEPLLTAK